MKTSLVIAAAIITAAVYLRFQPTDCEPIRIASVIDVGGCDHSSTWRKQ